MTREEAIEQLNFMIETIPKEPSAECDSIKEWLDTDKDIRNALDMAIKALEHELCDDAVSRKAVLNTLNRMDSVLDEDRTVETYKKLLIACYKDLPPVTPTKCIATVKFSKEDMQEIVDKKVKEMIVRKKGKWINKSHTSDCGIKFVASECTCCGKKTFFDCDQLVYNYCPNCGAEMESE